MQPNNNAGTNPPNNPGVFGVPQQNPQVQQQPPVQAQPQQTQPQQEQPQQTQRAGQQNNQVSRNPNSTQNTLQFAEIRDNMIIMNDGSFRAVVACKSINFDLMSDREREGVEYSYQNFLNSLNFQTQILIKSRRIDIAPYIDKLSDMRRNEENMLLGVLMDDYIDFIDMLAQEANIMEKSFYIVIPYFPGGDLNSLVSQSKGFFGKLFAKPENNVTHINAADFQKAKDEIRNRVDTILAGIFQMGVQGVQLDTKMLGELMYSSYNPDTALRQPINNFDNLAGLYVRKGGPEQQNTGGAQ